MSFTLEVRAARPEDALAVHALALRAFGRQAVADLNDRLRAVGRAALELVATVDGTVVGHVMLSPVVFEADVRGVALGPICVEEAHRRRGIMRRLVEAGLAGVRDQGWDFVMLLGSPALYPRFGFAPGVDFGLRSDFEVPDDEFMVLELSPGALGGVSGTVRFAPEFRDV